VLQAIIILQAIHDKSHAMTQIITLVGVIFSFLVGSAGLWVGLTNSRRTNYINSITAARIRYIQEIRNRISELTGLAYSYNMTLFTSHSLAATPEKQFEMQREFDRLKYLIKLHLNPEDTYWDDKIFKLVDAIIDLKDEDPVTKINELITITQYLLKMEWERVKLESKKGILSEVEKKKLSDDYARLYDERVRNGN
jgi:hypothetical protein